MHVPTLSALLLTLLIATLSIATSLVVDVKIIE